MRKVAVLAVVAALALGTRAQAQEAPKPGPEYKILKARVGTWETNLKAGLRFWDEGLRRAYIWLGDMEDDPSFILGNVQLNNDTANPSFAQHHRISDYETLDLQLSYEFLKPDVQAYLFTPVESAEARRAARAQARKTPPTRGNVAGRKRQRLTASRAASPRP